MKHLLPLLSLALGGSASAQSAPEFVTPFPLHPSPSEASFGLELQADAAAIAALHSAGIERLRLTQVPHPGDAPLELELTPVEVDFRRAQVVVDGVERPAGLDTGDLSLWSGRVAGAPDSEAFFAFSSRGSRGWFRRGGEWVHLMLDEGSDDRAPVARLVTQGELEDAGARFGATCEGALSTTANQVQRPAAGSGAWAAGSTETLECKVAWESDFQLFERFQSFEGMQNYIGTVLGAVAYRYREQVDVELVPVYLGFHTDVLDGWVTPDIPGSSTSEMLQEFRGVWMNNIPNGGNLAHFLSGANLGGGIAYLDVLCNSTFGFAVSANLTHFGRLPGSPASQGPLTWDYVVIAHETGHNFGSPHTFDYNPQIDNCPNQCTSQGTVMSYCHLCAGGLSNITTYFHPRVVDVMRQAAESSCFPSYCGARNYCRSRPNTTAESGALMGWSGSTSAAANDLVLHVSDAAAGKFGLFYYGEAEIRVPFGEGFRCVGAGASGTFRLHPVTSSDAFGSNSHALDLDAPPASSGPGSITPGDTWNFQYWFRDPQGGPEGFNLSDGLAVKFCP